MGIPYFVYPFIRWWTFGLFPCFSYCKQWCCEHLCTSFCLNICFQFSWYISRSGIYVLCDYSMFNFLRNCLTVFQSGCFILLCPKQWWGFPISVHPCQYLLLAIFFIIVILVGVKWLSHWGLDIHFSDGNDTEHLFTYLLAI